MGIPESQLETWAKQGSVTQSRDTYNTIKNVLEDKDAPYSNQSFEVFLQGSYGNDTNIFADSDVDLVIRCDSVFLHDLEALDETAKTRFHGAYPNATYLLPDFKKEVTLWLTQEFGADAKQGKKAIFIKGSGNRRDADVLPAAQLRRYSKFNSPSDSKCVEGICFFKADGTRIDNFPKQHAENCTLKHKGTNQWFKPMVRVLKNMRNRMIQDGSIEDELAPSYYLEGLLYNVPIGKFGKSYFDSCVNIIDWLVQADRSDFVCANEQYYLLRDGLDVTWREVSCAAFLKAAVNLWDDW